MVSRGGRWLGVAVSGFPVRLCMHVSVIVCLSFCQSVFSVCLFVCLHFCCACMCVCPSISLFLIFMSAVYVTESEGGGERERERGGRERGGGGREREREEESKHACVLACVCMRFKWPVHFDTRGVTGGVTGTMRSIPGRMSTAASTMSSLANCGLNM